MAVAACVAVAGCGTPAATPLCDATKLVAQTAELVRDKGGQRFVRFQARLTDGNGEPIKNAEVNMTVRYGRTQEEAGGPRAAGGDTNDDGVATGEVPAKVIEIRAARAGVFPVWGAEFFPRAPHEEYCQAKADGQLPENVVRLGARTP